MIKSLSLLVRKEGLSRAPFVEHWVDVHAPLAHKVPGVRRYVQSHILEERRRSPEAKALHADGARFIGRIKTFTIEEKVIIE